MDNLNRLEEIFAKFPGIGPRQAKRFVYYLINKSSSSIKEFTQLVEDVKKSTSECEQCHRFFVKNSSNKQALLCSVCSDPNRDNNVLMIVARDTDFETIEKSTAYKGKYFILGGSVPILDKDPDKRIRLEKLLFHISKHDEIKEIILSLNATPDGEHTAQIVKEAINKILENKSVVISVLGRGLSTGAELEYVDSETIKNALKNRF